ncbi:hypothetical protein ERO13_A06G093100v2 [Gossypium hirsutum]|uniref:Uncharacterized protein n=2 Tax=Gossypium TaxID=3633 RepID=A0A5D2YVD9_GOSMU|nr:hypothetical protein ERO13_A06G093100v2 [Gossypium hirsutum]TYI22524.1 hypothetical protein ES332_A06G109900v1 [Gossypium tomentosum]TYJ29929.1 hypothetical protein E1A91_A06G100200v1 [Gossypium mustelinum]
MRLSAPFLSPTSVTEKGSPMSRPWGISGVRRPSEACEAAMTEAWWPMGGEKFGSSMLGGWLLLFSFLCNGLGFHLGCWVR